MHEIEIIATNKLRVRLCQAIKQLGRGLRALPPPVAELGACMSKKEPKACPQWEVKALPAPLNRLKQPCQMVQFKN